MIGKEVDEKPKYSTVNGIMKITRKIKRERTYILWKE